MNDLIYHTSSFGKIIVPKNFNAASLHVDQNLEKTPYKPAIISNDHNVITYKELHNQVSRSGDALLSVGAKKNDVVLIALPDIPLTIVAFLAAMKIGAVPAIVNPGSTRDEVEYMIEKSEAKFLLCSNYARFSLKGHKRTAPATVVLTVGGETEGCIDFNKLLATANSNLDTFKTERTDRAYIVFSSGTTGRPKAVLHQHKDIVFTTYQFLDRIMHATSDDIYYSGSRLFFSAGRMIALHLPLMSGATTVLVSDRPSQKVISNTISKYKPTVFLAIPSLYSMLMKAAEANEISLDFDSLRLCLSGGEPLPPAVFQKWKDKTGKEILGAIGSSEAEWHFISQFQSDIKPEATGRVIPGWQVKLLDEKGDRINSPLTLGTAWIKSDSIAECYLNDPENTVRKFVDGWFNTDDMFYFDKDDYYYFVGRNDSLFKVKGRWVSPVEVERTILEHPSVVECMVFSATDEEGLNRPRALIVAARSRDSDLSILARNIFDSIAGKLPDYKTPKEYGFVDSLEKTSNGKIRRVNAGEYYSRVTFFSVEAGAGS